MREWDDASDDGKRNDVEQAHTPKDLLAGSRNGFSGIGLIQSVMRSSDKILFQRPLSQPIRSQYACAAPGREIAVGSPTYSEP